MTRCIACNKAKTTDSPLEELEGDALDMFNFVCCLELSEPEDSQGICKECHEELRVSFNFKKRCLEIFANVFDEPSPDQQPNDDDEEDFPCLDGLLAQSLHEDDNSLNLNDLLIPEVCLGNTALSMLDVSDNTKCRYCFIEFSSKSECVSHMESHKGDDKPYKCPQEGCHSSFKARKNLKDHYLVHSNERPFPCHFCEQTFKSSSNRSKHERRIHTKERNAMRSAANQQQLIKQGQEKLSKVKVEPPPPLPPVLKIRKEPPAALKTSSDDDNRAFTCDEEGCFSSFKTRSSLRDHQKVHSDYRPYKCAFCSSAFKSSSNRSKHERGSHSEKYQKRKLEREIQRNGDANDEPAVKKVKIAPVVQSPKVIKLEPSPKVVIKIEPSPSPKKQASADFPCRYCDRVFKKAEGRDRHETTHKDSNAFDCGFCSKNFKTQEALRAHTKTHTQSKLSCSHPGCDEVYPDRRSLKEHENSHSPDDADLDYACDEENCGKTYSSPKALRNHKRVKHEDDLQEISCDICNTSFKKADLQEHLALHI